MHSLNCNPSEPAETGLLLSRLLWHLRPYCPSSLRSRAKAALCVVLAPTLVQWDITVCAVHTQTCSLMFLLYFKGIATDDPQYVNKRFFSPFYLFIGPCWQPGPSRCQWDQRRKGELGWDAREGFGHTFVNSFLGPQCWKYQGCWPNIYLICV